MTNKYTEKDLRIAFLLWFPYSSNFDKVPMGEAFKSYMEMVEKVKNNAGWL